MKQTIASVNIRLMFWLEIFGTLNFLQPVMTLFYKGDQTEKTWPFITEMNQRPGSPFFC